MSCFSLSLFAQSFSHDHTGFFFSSENEKKLSFEVSTLKAELELCQAELESKRQTHQNEEKALRARVVEAEQQTDVAALEASKNVEAMKKECHGIASSFSLFFVFKLAFLLTCLLLLGLALRVEK